MSSTDPPHPAADGPIRPERGARRQAAPKPLTADVDPEAELRARLSAQETESTLRLGTVLLIAFGLLLAAAILAMLIVAW